MTGVLACDGRSAAGFEPSASATDAGGLSDAGAGRGSFVGPSQEAILRRVGPSPRELRDAVAGDADDLYECRCGARQKDGRGYRRAAAARIQATRRHQRADQRQPEERGAVPENPHLDGLVAGEPSRRERGDQQTDDAEALCPWRPAEEQPPRDNRRTADEPSEDADEELGRGSGADDRRAEPR